MIKLVSLCLFLLPFCAFSQQRITADYQNKPLSEIIPELEVEYHIIFSYTQTLIQDQTITTRFQNLNLDEALSTIFKHTDIQFEIINKAYIVLKSLEEGISESGFLLCGKITDATGEALAFSNIFIKKTGQGISTGEQGIFHLNTKINPSDTIEFSYVGYQKQQRIAAQLADCPTIVLKLQTFSFSEIIVKEYITQGIEQSEELDHLVLHPDQIDVVPGLTEADVLQMIQILPGVQSPDESAAGLHIRGGTPDQNLILWDGIPVYNSGHFFGMISAFNPYIVDNVKVFRGGFGAKYGGRVSGVIDISSEQRIPEKIKANAGINFTHCDAAVVTPFFKNKAALFLSARRSYTNILESPTFKNLSEQIFQKGKINDQQNSNEEEELDLKVNYVFSDLNTKWWWQPDDRNELVLSFFGIFDKLRFSSDYLEEDVLEIDDLNLDNLGLSAKWKRQWHPDFASEAKVSFSDLQNVYQFTFAENGNVEPITGWTQFNDIEDLTFQINNDWQCSPNTKMVFGYQFSDFLVRRKFESGETGEVEEFLNNNVLHTAHLTFKPKLKEQIHLSLGIRYNYFNALKKSFFEPRVSIHYVPDKHWQFKLSAGNYWQFISQVIELNDLGFNEQLWTMPDLDEDIPVAGSWNFSTGFLFHPNNFQLEADAYFKKLSGLISYSFSELTILPEEVFSGGSGDVIGVDVLLKKRWSNYQTWLSYTWSRVHYTFDKFNLGKPFPAPHDRSHALTFMHLLNYKNWQVSIAWKYATGKVFTEAIGISMNESDYFPVYSNNAINSQRLPAYHRLNASVLFKFSPKGLRLKGMAGLSFINLYNRKNILSRQYVIGFDDDEEVLLQTLDRPSLKFTPNVVLRFTWK